MFVPGAQAFGEEAADGQQILNQVGGSGFNKSRISRVWAEDEFLNRGLQSRPDSNLISLSRAVE